MAVFFFAMRVLAVAEEVLFLVAVPETMFVLLDLSIRTGGVASGWTVEKGKLPSAQLKRVFT
ncbi:MAG: hypothetical protein WEA31_02250 [Pirellulales bacterium]